MPARVLFCFCFWFFYVVFVEWGVATYPVVSAFADSDNSM